MSQVSRIVIYGGRSSIGAACVNHFKASNWWVANIDSKSNEKADANIMMPGDQTWVQMEKYAVKQLGSALDDGKLKVDAIICVASGWTEGNAAKNLSQQVEQVWKQSVWTSTIATTLATKYLKPQGLIGLMGSKTALKGTPSMVGYGMAKAAVHHLTKSLGSNNSGLPRGALAVAVLPEFLAADRYTKWMSEEDANTWTPLTIIAELFEKWAKNVDRPPNGSLVLLDARKDEDKLKPVPEITILE